MRIAYIYPLLWSVSILCGVGWLYNYPEHRDVIVTHTISMKNNLLSNVPDMDDNGFVHNFCESRLQDNKGPEIWNTATSFVISIVPFIYGFPKYPLLYNVACMLSFNGIASAYYHYYLSWFGKQADEVSMILATYFGTWAFINMCYQRCAKRNNLNRFNTLFMYVFLITNTLVKYNILFPSVFGIYVGCSLIMIIRVAQKYDVPCIKNLTISSIGAISWIISENYCTEYTMFGHVIWHLLFPYGFYRLILEFDKIKQRLPVLDRIDE